MAEYRFHPAVSTWLTNAFGEATLPQQQGWPAIQQGRHTLIAAPTGSGKTLAAFLAAINALVEQGLADGALADRIQVLYVSPLKALSNDIEKNLREPLAGIREELARQGLPDVEIRTLVRTGDTPASERTAMLRRPPHIYVTTPESLYLLLTSEKARHALRHVRTVIVDEIHALVADKRGAHLSLSLERLAHLTGQPLQRIGLSATQRPIEEVARFLVGTGAIAADGTPDCAIVDAGLRRKLDLAIELPGSPLETVMSGEVWGEVYERLSQLILQHRTTLLFVNTRAMAERVSRQLSELLGEEHVTTHHGSLSREKRLDAEQRLKSGQLRALVATASLELGIDIGAVDLVCQLGTTRAISTFLQRAGRSRHHHGGVPKARLFPLSRDELMECAALLDALGRGELESLSIPAAPLELLAQQIVATVACEEWSEDDLYHMVRRAFPYRDLAREDFTAVVRMLAEGFAARMGRRAAYLHRDAVNGRLRPRKGARLAAITSGGAIPDNADFQVVLDHTGLFIGTVNEDFAIESIPGDIFQLGNTAWRIMRVAEGKVRVEDAHGQPPTIPFWLGEAPGRSTELSAAVSRVRAAVAERLGDATEAAPGERVVGGMDAQAAVAYLTGEVGMDTASATQLADYLLLGQAALGAMPTQDTLVAERFFDEGGGMQLVLHAPFGSRLNRAWGLALRKRFCRQFNFELQAAAMEDAIVLSLGPTHSFPLGDVFRYLNAETVRDVLVQALLDAPMFEARWRWNATRALAVLRFRGGKKTPPQLQRMQAGDLLALVFPDQQACLENIQGDREIPDHPLVNQTIRDCLEEATDLAGLQALLRAIAAGEKTLIARDVTEPSPLAQQVLNARPYAFLDDAPLEERRTQAVASRRWLDADTADDLGALDASAVLRVRGEAWPQARNADELHDALMLLGFATEAEGAAGDAASGSMAAPGEANVLPLPLADVPPAEAPASSHGWGEFLATLTAEGRATRLLTTQGTRLWVAAERLAELLAVYPDARLAPAMQPLTDTAETIGREAALIELVRNRLEGLGPLTTAELALAMDLPEREVQGAMLQLEAEGFVLRGRFTPGRRDAAGAPAEEWCDRRLLARIHRYTLNRLRQEIQPVTPVEFLRFLTAWQRMAPGSQGEGADSLDGILTQLEGFETPAAAWEEALLPARLNHYEPGLLDGLCLSGRAVWLRLTPPGAGRQGRLWGPVRATPITLVQRQALGRWQRLRPAAPSGRTLSAAAEAVQTCLQTQGASFFADMQAATGLLQTQLEAALAELVAWGRISSDSFAGLRALLQPQSKRPAVSRRLSGPGVGMDRAGRWSLLGTPPAAEAAPADVAPAATEQDVEAAARTLLRRYGVVFRRLLERETLMPPWRDLLRVYRRLEARGELRGGRFVEGMAGEQYALAEAVGMLRNQRRQDASGELLCISGADPLNLVGIVTPGDRLPALTGNRLLLRDGEPIALREGRNLRFLVELDADQQAQAERSLNAKPARAAWRRRLGHAG